MTERRKATPVTLTAAQRARLERLWFVYGNYGPKARPGNHQFIQGLLEHGLDLRPLQTKRTPKKDRPTEECEAAVETVLASGADADESATRSDRLRLVTPVGGGRKVETPDPELKKLLDEMRRRHCAPRGGGLNSSGEDAA